MGLALDLIAFSSGVRRPGRHTPQAFAVYGGFFFCVTRVFRGPTLKSIRAPTAPSVVKNPPRPTAGPSLPHAQAKLLRPDFVCSATRAFAMVRA